MVGGVTSRATHSRSLDQIFSNVYPSLQTKVQAPAVSLGVRLRGSDPDGMFSQFSSPVAPRQNSVPLASAFFGRSPIQAISFPQVLVSSSRVYPSAQMKVHSPAVVS